MRKYCALIIWLCLAVSLVSAASLGAVYQSDSVEALWIKRLCIETGITPPLPAAPWSGYELYQSLMAIDREALSATGKTHFDILSRRLVGRFDPQYPVHAQVELSPEIYVQTNEDTTLTGRDWARGYADRQGMLSVSAETLFGEHVYGLFDFEAKNTVNYERLSEGETSFIGTFQTNDVLFSPDVQLENRAPFNAFAGYSDPHISLIAGRGVVSLGRGNTGNLLVGDHVDFHDFTRFSAANNTVAYTFLTLSYDGIDNEGTAQALSFDENMRLFIAHHLAVNLGKRIRLSLAETALFYTSRLDLRMFSPLMFIHNYNNFDETNNAMQAELEVALARGVSFHIQAMVDQIALFGETLNATPNAWGVLGGLDFAIPLGKGLLTGWAEGVYTSPYLYLRGTDDWNLSLIGAHAMWSGAGIDYIGYQYGPDSIVAALSLGYEEFEKYRICTRVLFGAHGENGRLGNVSSWQLDTGETAFRLISPSGTPEYRLICSVEGGYTLGSSGWSASGCVDAVTAWNYQNIEDESFFDIQISLGVTYAWHII